MELDEVLALLAQYGWAEKLDTELGLPTGKWKKYVTMSPVPTENQRIWLLQFTFKTSGLTVYIEAPAINSLKLNETVGPVDPLYHDIDSLTARLIQLQ